ncbi:MAG: recN [Phycisphaerales bacterium]|nr:recN [Phycisphaerales bacterium]
MLRELHISNLAVISDVRIELSPGLNCFTGATGAGKSLVIGAVEVLLGLRSPAEMLRHGADEGRVSGVFDVGDPALLARVQALTDIPVLDDGGELLLTRRLYASGRSSVSLNGNPITLGMLKQVAEFLVDVHGQHDHQYLLKPANQLDVIDQFGGLEPLRKQYHAVYARVIGARERIAELAASRTLRKQQLELYRFQAAEIDKAELDAAEYEKLEARAAVLTNLEKLKRDAGAVHAAVYEADGSVLERLKGAAGVLAELAHLDPNLKAVAQGLKDATIQVEESAYDLSRYLDKLDLDPAELAEVNDRLNTIIRVVNKYGDTVEGTLAYREEVGGKLAELEKASGDDSGLQQQLAPLLGELKKLGAELSAKRRAVATKIGPLIEGQLAALGMEKAKFTVSVGSAPATLEDAAPATAPVNGTTQGAAPVRAGTPPLAASQAKGAGASGSSSAAKPQSGSGAVSPHATGVSTAPPAPFALLPATPSGFDVVEFVAQTNPGQPAQPLRKIASGGELSRIMLALKGILAAGDRVSVLVFDEIDSNVGGRLGSIIGNKLRSLADHHQVLCITHLPQIASYADRHLTVRKEVVDNKTETKVRAMEGEDRVRELAEMTGGQRITDTTLAQARELLDAAESEFAGRPTRVAHTRPPPGQDGPGAAPAPAGAESSVSGRRAGAKGKAAGKTSG